MAQSHLYGVLTSWQRFGLVAILVSNLAIGLKVVKPADEVDTHDSVYDLIDASVPSYELEFEGARKARHFRALTMESGPECLTRVSRLFGLTRLASVSIQAIKPSAGGAV